MAHGKKKKSPNGNLTADPLTASAITFNNKFRENVPLYFIDSGVVITFGLIRILKEAGLGDGEIRNCIVHGSRKTINGEPIEGNWSNIDSEGAEKLMNVYNENQKGKCAICIVPAVYKETMMDGKAHDNTRRQFTRKFVTENCFLVVPNEALTTFARKTSKLQEELKDCVSADGKFGLNPEIKSKHNKQTGEKYWVDVNFEDRLILAQTAVIAKQGKANVTFLSCSHLDQPTVENNVQKLYSYSLALDNSEVKENIPRGNGFKVVYLQHNSRDYGRHGTSRRGKGIVGRNSVAEQIDEVLDNFFNGDGDVKIIVPNELGE